MLNYTRFSNMLPYVAGSILALICVSTPIAAAQSADDATRVFVVSLSGERAEFSQIHFDGSFPGAEQPRSFNAEIEYKKDESKRFFRVSYKDAQSFEILIPENIFLNHRVFATSLNGVDRFYVGMDLIQGELLDIILKNEPDTCPMQNEDWLTISFSNGEVTKIEVLRTQGCRPVRVDLEYKISSRIYEPIIP